MLQIQKIVGQLGKRVKRVVVIVGIAKAIRYKHKRDTCPLALVGIVVGIANIKWILQLMFLFQQP